MAGPDISGIIFILLAIYALAATGGIFAERAGVINLSIDGTMTISAGFYILFAKLMGDSVGTFDPWMMIVGMIGSIVVGMTFNTLLSFAAINLRGNQVIVGTALNVAAPIISLIVIIALTSGQYFVQNTFAINQFSTAGFQGYKIQIIVACLSLVIVGIFWLFQRFAVSALRMKAAGENPFALDAAGISVIKTRHKAMLISGFLASMAGVVVVTSNFTVSTYSNSTLGIGFIAIAILIIGQWRIHWAVLGSAVFGAIYGVVSWYSVSVGNYQYLILVVPYVATIVLLPTISRFARQPKAAGIPFYNAGR